MAVEIERKFLVVGDEWRREVVRQQSMRQGYLNRPGSCSVRLRIQGDEAFLNIKQAVTGRERLEFDYSVPLQDAMEMLDALADGPLIEKTRYWVECAGVTWEIDVFHGENAGLVVAEVELDEVDANFVRPSWLGREVTDEERYYNVALSRRPYSQWTDAERRG
ncbi:MAG TPA: CYTH domain-containing protein [Gammaproteobacteria bacterium]|nr:CYTH domain-containing protein [Gammaproteobacteria bacterium]